VTDLLDGHLHVIHPLRHLGVPEGGENVLTSYFCNEDNRVFSLLKSPSVRKLLNLNKRTLLDQLCGYQPYSAISHRSSVIDLIHALDLIHAPLMSIDLIHAGLDLIHARLDLIHALLDLIHARLDIIHGTLG
jgi:hypothetical protein